MTDSAEPGVGCRRAAASVALLLLLAGVSFAIGLRLTLDESCVGGCEQTGLALYAAGAPVSGLFAALAGGLPVAWPVDLIAWIGLGGAAAVYGERRGWSTWAAPAALFGLALLYGLGVSLLVERA